MGLGSAYVCNRPPLLVGARQIWQCETKEAFDCPADVARSEKDRLMSWIKRRPTGTSRDREETQEQAKPQRFAVPAQYRPLHKYLADRYADTVVLTFSEIEDLLGFTLPDLARLQQEWWTKGDADSAPSAQSRSWTQASRTATPNLSAQTVVFVRG